MGEVEVKVEAEGRQADTGRWCRTVEGWKSKAQRPLRNTWRMWKSKKTIIKHVESYVYLSLLDILEHNTPFLTL